MKNWTCYARKADIVGVYIADKKDSKEEFYTETKNLDKTKLYTLIH